MSESVQCTICGVHFKKHHFGHDCKGKDWHKFHTAKYYTTDDAAESLSSSDWDEVIDQWVENFHPGFDPENPNTQSNIHDVIADACPVTVYAYVSKELHRSFAVDMVDRFIDEL